MPIRQGGILASRASTWATPLTGNPGRHGPACAGHATTIAAARWRRAHRGLRRGTSSCEYRRRSRRFAVFGVWDMACSLSLVPLPASLAGGVGARPDHPISRHSDRGVPPRNTVWMIVPTNGDYVFSPILCLAQARDRPMGRNAEILFSELGSSDFLRCGDFNEIRPF